MKVMIAILALLMIGMAVGGGLYYRHTTETGAALRAELADAKRLGDTLQADLATSKKQADSLGTDLASARQKNETLSADVSTAKKQSETLSAEFAASKKQGEALTTELASAKARGDSLLTELDQTKARLADVSAAGTKSAQQSDALAGVLTRRTALERVINDELTAALSKADESEKALIATPSATNFTALKRSLNSAIGAIDRATPLLDDLGSYLERNASQLSTSADVVRDIGNRIVKARLELPTLQGTLRGCLDSCKETKLGVSSQEVWQAAELSVAKGNHVAIAATGTWSYAPSRGNRVGPLGDNDNANWRVFPHVANGALMARIHGSESGFVAVPGFVADRDGKLEFRINDNQVSDNEGTIDVAIWTFKPSPQD